MCNAFELYPTPFLLPNSAHIYPHSPTYPTFGSSFHCFSVHFVLPLILTGGTIHWSMV